jgi:hypothetical protein
MWSSTLISIMSSLFIVVASPFKSVQIRSNPLKSVPNLSGTHAQLLSPRTAVQPKSLVENYLLPKRESTSKECRGRGPRQSAEAAARDEDSVNSPPQRPDAAPRKAGVLRPSGAVPTLSLAGGQVDAGAGFGRYRIGPRWWTRRASPSPALTSRANHANLLVANENIILFERE